jgi:hypothetical protein
MPPRRGSPTNVAIIELQNELRRVQDGMEVMEEAQSREPDIGDFSEDEDTSSEEEVEAPGGETTE